MLSAMGSSWFSRICKTTSDVEKVEGFLELEQLSYHLFGIIQLGWCLMVGGGQRNPLGLRGI